MRRVRLAALLISALSLALPAQALDRVRIGKSGVALAWTMIEAGEEAKIWPALGLDIR
jgi:hypothetical protein